MDKARDRMRVAVYLRPEVATALDLAAQDEHRTVSAMVAHVLEEWLRREGKALRPVRCGACGTWRDATVGACSTCTAAEAPPEPDRYRGPPAGEGDRCPRCGLPCYALTEDRGGVRMCCECALEVDRMSESANGG